MKRADRRRQGLGAIELIEQAIHELRTAPLGTLATYYVGALPFVLGLLFFWADMSRSAYAGEHLTDAALGMAALFLWMKFWQAVFARNLRASFAGEPPPPLGLRRSCRILLAQTVLQPTGLFILPIAAIVTLPFAWVCAFYQNLTALAEAEHGEVRQLFKRAARQAALWPKQNHVLLAILSGFGLYVFLNWMTVCFMVPSMVKTLLGVETIFTRSPFSLLNTTFLAAVLGLTYLSVDPIIKAVYALRCFYGESLESGEDLKAELRRLALAAQPVAACLLVAMMIFGATSSRAAESQPPACRVGRQTLAPRSSDFSKGQTRCDTDEILHSSRLRSIAGFQSATGYEPESQRRSITQPRVARRRYPGCPARVTPNPEGVAPVHHGMQGEAFGYNPLRVVVPPAPTQGSAPAQPWADRLERRWRSPRGRDHAQFARSCNLEAPLPCRRPAAVAHSERKDAPVTQPAAPPQPTPTAAPASVSPTELDRTIQDVIQQTKYAWRLPREKLRESEAEPPGFIGRFLRDIGKFIKRKIKDLGDWLDEWLRKFFKRPRERHSSGYDWMVWLEVLLYALLAAVVAGLAWLLFRLWQNRRRKAGPVAAQPIQPVPDLTDENLGAEQLPEDGWTKLARELLARGEFRLAVRAFYFASLAHLAERNLISLAKFKSNRDYERELRRRGHSFPEVLSLFGENVMVVDRTWYGLHPVDGDQVSHFAVNVERIRMGE